MAGIPDLQPLRGVTVLLVEQNAKAALAMSDYGLVLELGQTRMFDRAEALLRDSCSWAGISRTRLAEAAQQAAVYELADAGTHAEGVASSFRLLLREFLWQAPARRAALVSLFLRVLAAVARARAAAPAPPPRGPTATMTMTWCCAIACCLRRISAITAPLASTRASWR